MLRFCCTGAVGDTIVGRVKQVEGGRWKLDVNSQRDAELRLVNVQLPGGEQVGAWERLILLYTSLDLRFEQFTC